MSLGVLVGIRLREHLGGHNGLLDKESANFALDGRLLKQDKDHIRTVVGKDPAAREECKISIRLIKNDRQVMFPLLT